MSCRVLDYKTFVSDDTREYMGFFNGPFTYVRPVFLGFRVFFLGMRWLPSGFPVVCKLLVEQSIDIGGLILMSVNLLHG